MYGSCAEIQGFGAEIWGSCADIQGSFARMNTRLLCRDRCFCAAILGLLCGGRFRALLRRHRAFLKVYKAVMRKCRAFVRRYRALLRRYRALFLPSE